MYLPFDSLPGHSRLWVYQSNRKFTDSEKEELSAGLTMLCQEWVAHGNPLHTSFTLPFDQFVILAVDERQAGASGCSIDGSVRYLKGLQEKLGLDFFNRRDVAFLAQSKLVLYPLTEIRELLQNKTLIADAIAFNNTVTTKAEWESGWRIPVKNSWLARYLPKTSVAG